MGTEFEQKAITAALEARRGMSESNSKQLADFNAAQFDWFAFCKKCGERISGTIAQIKEHSCGK